jgi:Heavy metal binding domain
MRRLRLLIPLSTAICLGCADGAALYGQSVDYAHNPAVHPSAPEAPFVPPPPLGASKRPEASAELAPGPVVYTCPMHPEIVSDAPGKCPKCGMALSPRPKAESAPAHQHHQHGRTP